MQTGSAEDGVKNTPADPMHEHQLCCMPAMVQPRLPSSGLVRCQTSLKASGAAFTSSRNWPEKRTLANARLASVLTPILG